MGFTIPNSGESSYPIQSEPDRGDFTALTSAAGGTGVVSGCLVTATGTPDLNTHIASGVVSVNGTSATPTADSLTHSAADVSHDRIDLVVYANTATPGYGILEGTPAVTPLFSSTYDPSIHVILAAVLVEASSTTITPAHIVDKRVMYLSTASSTTFTPAGTITSTDVQAAIEELDNDVAPKASPTFTGTVTIPNGASATDAAAYGQTQLRSGGGLDTVNNMGNITGATTANLANGNMQYGTLTGNVTFTFSGATNGSECEMVLSLTQDGTGSRTITWPASVKWAGGVGPTISTAASANDQFVFRTRDGGTTWYGALIGKGFA